ncbi:CPBP family intramembrane glutamic endopeptidase [Pseudooceanicola algae]|uniref:CAAX prenyl protease 2/Lysostaphin resistance protein A-like domain-containing protein n=1 Tax=Pseudooceanicola algae TaxID=1537215 RepID=A0A418SJY6_9RHOB|nr:type II CAAX endopeptidase family protein [Pseudooceanicola algae]QPM92214.1 hypothetical protein PSAL_034780 [Pseudooceanicola algae]
MPLSPDPTPPRTAGDPAAQDPSARGRIARHRVKLAFGLLVLWALVTLGINSLVLAPDAPPEDLMVRGPLWGIVIAGAGMLILLLVLRRRGHGVALRAPLWGQLRLFWVPALYLLLFLTPTLVMDLPAPRAIGMIALNTFFVGLSEELMFRGVLFPALRSRMRIWPAIWLSSVIFGLAHVSNIAITGSLAVAGAQALAATCSALVFMALLLRTGSLWPCILFHAAWDFSLILLTVSAPEQESPTAVADINPLLLLAPVLLILPNALYALWMMRHAGTDRLPGDPGRAHVAAA